MRYAGFCGPSNPNQSLIANCERLQNLYPEQIQSQGAPTDAALLPVPGEAPRYATTDVGARALFAENGRCWAVIGGGFWELFEDGTSTRRGDVAQDADPATISSNGLSGGHLFITSGGSGYCFELATNTLTTVLPNEATMGGHLNGRFLAFNIQNGHVRISNLNDGLTWDPLLWFGRNQAPDPWRSMLVRPPEVWLIGESSGEVWYYTDSYPQPFAPIPGAFFPVGTCAPFAAQVAGDHIVWVKQDPSGAGAIVAARGYTPQVISNFAVETAVGDYQRTATISDAEVLVHALDGHLFASCNFPKAGGNWTYDFSMGAWHERLSWRPATGWSAWKPRVHCHVWGKHLVGQRDTGVISVLDRTTCTEADGSVIRRVRVAPPLYAKPGERLVVDRFQVYAEPGLGTLTGQGSNPLLMLRTSPDAKTWSHERTALVGRMGEYRKSCVFHRCGSSETLWVPEISMTDPIPWRLAGADVIGSGFEQVAR
jgi:hypothetical protein